MSIPEKANYLVTPIASHQGQQQQQQQQSDDSGQGHSSTALRSSNLEQPTAAAAQADNPPGYDIYQPSTEPTNTTRQTQIQGPNQYHYQNQYQPPTYPPPPPQPTPAIRLALLNPRKLSSGFSQSQPSQLAQLATSPIDPTTWTNFITEINETLHKAPGTLLKGVTNFWLVNLVSLGMSSHLREMYRSRVEAKAVDVIERYNRTVFASWGIRASFDVVPVGGVVGYNQLEYMRREREYRGSQYEDDTQALELVISRI
ncbi:hypothetical protein LPJ56_000878 [Coemansia sp. RSA 2599]|nr:hypothetical protein LPJ56_000878 [Coemansia sp. RSA 2599]